MYTNKRHLFLLCCLAMLSCRTTLKDEIPSAPTGLRYVNVGNAREGGEIKTAPPTVETGGLTPTFEVVGVSRADGSFLDETYLQYVSVGTTKLVDTPISPDEGYVDRDGNPLTFFTSENTASNGVITIAAGNNFSADDYYFDVKVTTTD